MTGAACEAANVYPYPSVTGFPLGFYGVLCFTLSRTNVFQDSTPLDLLSGYYDNFIARYEVVQMSLYDDHETGSDSNKSYLNCCKEPDDFYTLMAAGLMVAGIVFMTVGYVVPRDYEFNPFAPAREMESIEKHFARLSYNLDVIITVGMGFVAAGGLIMAAVMCYAMCFDKDHTFFDNESDNHVLRPHYGSTDRQTH